MQTFRRLPFILFFLTPHSFVLGQDGPGLQLSVSPNATIEKPVTVSWERLRQGGQRPEGFQLFLEQPGSYSSSRLVFTAMSLTDDKTNVTILEPGTYFFWSLNHNGPPDVQGREEGRSELFSVLASPSSLPEPSATSSTTPSDSSITSSRSSSTPSDSSPTPLPSPSPTPTATPNFAPSDRTASIAGAVAGAVLGLGLISLIIFLIQRSDRRRKRLRSYNTNTQVRAPAAVSPYLVTGDIRLPVKQYVRSFLGRGRAREMTILALSNHNQALGATTNEDSQNNGMEELKQHVDSGIRLGMKEVPPAYTSM